MITMKVFDWSTNPINGQTHSKNSSANCRRIVWVCLTILRGWRLTVNIFRCFNLSFFICQTHTLLIEMNLLSSNYWKWTGENKRKVERPFLVVTLFSTSFPKEYTFLHWSDWQRSLFPLKQMTLLSLMPLHHTCYVLPVLKTEHWLAKETNKTDQLVTKTFTNELAKVPCIMLAYS